MEYSRTKIKYGNDEMLISGLFESDHIFKHLKIAGNFYELKLLEKVKSLNLKGTYVDVGANIGNHSIYFSKFCNSEKVISIELDNKIYNVLNENVKTLNNVTTINVGVGEKPKKVKISDIDKTNVGMTKIIGDDGDIVVDTLDNLLNDIENITLIKIDVEGYEKNVLIGAKEIIKKHSPVIIAELRDGNEFNEFAKIALELGYETDKVNYASTPTYFFYKKKDTYDFVYLIPTYDRFDKVNPLIQNILVNNLNTLAIVLNDGSSDVRYKTLKNLSDRLVYLENRKNNGRGKFWLTINTLMNEMSKYKFKYGVMIGDDFKLVDGYQEKLESYINDKDIIRIFTQQHIGESNWGFKNWVDGAFCAPRSFFEKINFELFPIKDRGSNFSSGVGLQMSKRLTNLGYTVKNYGSLIDHIGNDDSKMHPVLRKKQPLITNFTNNSKIGLSIIIPTFGHPEFLIECLNSVIDSIKNSYCEILVGIDGCQNTLNFLKNKTFDERIKFFFFKKNVGPYVVKNSLSLIVNSDHILFFDSDDIMKESLIQDIINNKQKYDLIKPMYLDFKNDVNNINYKITNTKTYGEGVFSISKDLFYKMNGFEPWRCAADSELMGRLYKNKVKLTVLKSINFYRRIHQNSLTQHPDTGLKSKLRADYGKKIKTIKTLNPLEHITTEPFDVVNVKTKVLEKIDPLMEIKNKRDVLLGKVLNLTPETKSIKKVPINYESINSKSVYNPKEYKKELIKPKLKEKPITLNDDSLTKLRNEMFPSKPNRRTNTPNIFGNNQRRKGGFSI